MDPALSPSESFRGSAHFVTTQWAVVLQASKGGESQLQALQQLCLAYWYPLYAYVRRRGHSSEDAKDLTQEFFSRLLSKNWLGEIVPEGGRFRSFLLTAMNRFLANEYDRNQAKKRGGGWQVLPLDNEAAETQYLRELTTPESPETIFERRWALTVLEQALVRLERELVQAGKGIQFDLLNPFLSRDPESREYDAIAAQLNVTRGAVAVAVHRLRHRYREMLREEIASTLAEPSRIDEEMQHLFAVLRK
jgi:RNA polymerase sigma factor (sigma-70 family)